MTEHAMAFAPAREVSPYVAILGADFSYDWVLEHGDGTPEPLGQVVAARVQLERRGDPAASLSYDLGENLEVLTPNVVRFTVDKLVREVWLEGTYDGALFLSWADGTDEVVVLFAVSAVPIGKARVGHDAGRSVLTRAVSATRIVRTAGGRLTSIVPQIQVSACEFMEDLEPGAVVGLLSVDPPGAELTYSLANDGDGLIEIEDGFKLILARQADASAEPSVDIVVEGAVDDGDTRLRAGFTLTVVNVVTDGELDFSEDGNALFTVI
jgi:hypothetical protein